MIPKSSALFARQKESKQTKKDFLHFWLIFLSAFIILWTTVVHDIFELADLIVREVSAHIVLLNFVLQQLNDLCNIFAICNAFRNVICINGI